MKLPQKIGLGIGLAMLVTNPLPGQFVLQGLDFVFQQMFRYGAYISIVGTVYLVALLSIYTYQSSRVNIPEKSTTKSSAYLKT